LPNKLSAKISDNVGKYPYGTPNKPNQGNNTAKSFDFSSDDSKGQQDKVESLGNS